MKFDHGDSRVWITVVSVAAGGLVIYRLIPQHHLAAGAVTAGIIALMALKHLGLLSIFGAPLFASVRTWLRTRQR